MDTEGIDPSTFRMQSGRSTTDLSAQMRSRHKINNYKAHKVDMPEFGIFKSRIQIPSHEEAQNLGD
jgi:hypothetical protein